MADIATMPAWFNEATDEMVERQFTADKEHYQDQLPDPISWMEQHFYLYDTEQLITFHERQRRPLELAFERDVNGWYKYNTVLWSWPKKSAKSSVIAAICLYVLCNKSHASIKLVANDQKQSDSRVGYYLREAIKIAKQKDPGIGNFKVTPSGYTIENLTNGARCEMLPVDPSGEAGGNDDLIVYSELHGWKSAAHQKMFAEMALSPNKFGNSQIYIDTYAGYTGESPILEAMYQTGVTEGVRLLGDEWEVYGNATARLLAVWVTERWLPWQIDEQGRAYYESEASKLTPSEFDRMHGNQWVSSVSGFVPFEWWLACEGPMPAFDPLVPVVVGMDAGVSSDTFALVGVSRLEDMTYVRFVRVWKPPQHGKIDFADIDTFIRNELVKTYNVVQITYDPHQLHDLSTRLRVDGVAWMKEFNQGNPRLEADKALYDLIRDKHLIHSGDPVLTEHVKNANSKNEGDVDKLRIVKRAESLKIDAAVALSMAAYEIRRLNVA